MKPHGYSRIAMAAAIAVLLLACWPGQGLAKKYKSAAVKNGGTLKGVITLQGKATAAKKIKVTKDSKVCGDFVMDESLTVSKKGGIANAVVEIQGIGKGKKWTLPSPFAYDQSKCAFKPHIILVRPRAPGRVTNSDKVKHNFHTISKGIFNVNKTVAPGKALKVKKKKVKKPGIVRVTCDLHKWMGGWWWVAASPYVALTNGGGGFEIGGIPPGKYKVKIWQEKLGEQIREVEIKPGAVTTLNVPMKRRG